ncbi:MAG: DUF2268 domain-containing putative Zn-dependent protease [Tannerella sp.]|jgi:hypothetical protein|nr:DUF2268 domain-containing putative Zn-dependent protease [Tannerella sp.]
MKLWLIVCISALSIGGCQRKSFGMADGADAIHINRFDSALYRWIDIDDSISLQQVKDEYPQMLDLLGKALFKASYTDTSAFYDNLINYFSEPTLKSLYKDAIIYYSGDSASTQLICKELAYGFERMKELFLTAKIPAIYFHVSGLQQNFIIADSLLSCSIDKYLGADYQLYNDFFYDYQKKNMTPAQLPKDCFEVWLKSEFPFQGKDNILLDRMIYEGKIIYSLTKISKEYTLQNILSLSDAEFRWCIEYEKPLWTTIIERKHLYTPDAATTTKYFLPSPSTFIAAEAPGDLGYFIGYRIVECYMKQTKSSCEELMKNADSQDILTKSKYKP